MVALTSGSYPRRRRGLRTVRDRTSSHNGRRRLSFSDIGRHVAETSERYELALAAGRNRALHPLRRSVVHARGTGNRGESDRLYAGAGPSGRKGTRISWNAISVGGRRRSYEILLTGRCTNRREARPLSRTTYSVCSLASVTRKSLRPHSGGKCSPKSRSQLVPEINLVPRPWEVWTP